MAAASQRGGGEGERGRVTKTLSHACALLHTKPIKFAIGSPEWICPTPTRTVVTKDGLGPGAAAAEFQFADSDSQFSASSVCVCVPPLEHSSHRIRQRGTNRLETSSKYQAFHNAYIFPLPNSIFRFFYFSPTLLKAQVHLRVTSAFRK